MSEQAAATADAFELEPRQRFRPQCQRKIHLARYNKLAYIHSAKETLFHAAV
jgi:hypothetical protein